MTSSDRQNIQNVRYENEIIQLKESRHPDIGHESSK